MAETLTHPACGKSWVQHGNYSGHCTLCHATFYGLAAFDAHQRLVRGRPKCRDPRKLAGPWWKDSEGQWHLGNRPEVAA